VLNGFLWILRTGALWPERPNHEAVVSDLPSTLSEVGSVRSLEGHPLRRRRGLHDEGYLDMQETFADGSFAPAKKGGLCVGKRNAARDEDHGDRQTRTSGDEVPSTRILKFVSRAEHLAWRERWKNEGRVAPILHVLQLRAHPSDGAGDASDGSRGSQSCLEC